MFDVQEQILLLRKYSCIEKLSSSTTQNQIKFLQIYQGDILVKNAQPCVRRWARFLLNLRQTQIPLCHISHCVRQTGLKPVLCKHTDKAVQRDWWYYDEVLQVIDAAAQEDWWGCAGRLMSLCKDIRNCNDIDKIMQEDQWGCSLRSEGLCTYIRDTVQEDWWDSTTKSQQLNKHGSLSEAHRSLHF